MRRPLRPWRGPGRKAKVESGGTPVVRLALLAACLACTPAGPGADTGVPPGGAIVPPDGSGSLVPPGHGSLRQDEVTLTLRQAALQVKITPLEEWVLRLTAPDTYERLSGLAGAHRAEAARRTGVADPPLALVSFYSMEPGTTYEPEDVTLINRGRRFRPALIRPLTAGWGTRRLEARETQMAVYAFDGDIDLDMGLVAEYGDTRSTEWDAILQTLQAELARARARAGGGT